MKQYLNKCFVLDLSRKTDKKLAIIFGHLTYSASKLWNVANYEVIENGVPIGRILSINTPNVQDTSLKTVIFLSFGKDKVLS